MFRRAPHWPSFLLAMIVVGVLPGVDAAPALDKARYHTWEEVDAYLNEVANDPASSGIVELIPLGSSREGRPLNVLRISKEGIAGKDPDTKPAAFIMGAHHAREHISKEAVLALIDRLINGYGKTDTEGLTITYLLDRGTIYALPWVNPDGAANEWFHNPGQRKTNNPLDEPQIGAADCDSCGDGLVDEDSPSISTGDLGAISRDGHTLAHSNNGVITDFLQHWYEDENYKAYVSDERVERIPPVGSDFVFNYEGYDIDGDGSYAAYSGEDAVGGVDPNRNYGEPLWGDCADDDGCSFVTGDETYCGSVPFSEPETSLVAAFLRAHENIVTLESLHSGINEIYPPSFIFPDDRERSCMDEGYHDSVAQYVAEATGYEVVYGGPYPVKGDTTSYSYLGVSQDPELGLDWFAGGILSLTTEIYGMGSESGSAQAIQDWFPFHAGEFDDTYPQGLYIAWRDFNWCTTCDPMQMPGPRSIWDYLQYVDYFIFESSDLCGGATDPDIFHCDYWGVSESESEQYYADFDIFAYFNPPAVNRCYKDWNCDGTELMRTVDGQIKHLLYRLYVAPSIRVNAAQSACDAATLAVAIENTGLLRTSVVTNSRVGADPFEERGYDHGLVEVSVVNATGFTLEGAQSVNIGWLGGGRSDDPAPRIKTAEFDVAGMGPGDTFTVVAASNKTGAVSADLEVASCGTVPLCGNGVCEVGEDCLTCSADCTCRGPKCQRVCEVGSVGGSVINVLATNYADLPAVVDDYFALDDSVDEGQAVSGAVIERTRADIRRDVAVAEAKQQAWRRLEGPVDVIPGQVKGYKLNRYHH